MRTTGIVSRVLLPGLLLAGSTLAAGRAGAQPASADAPPLMPTRDAVVLYDVQPDGAPQPQPVRVYFRSGGSLMRIDGPPAQDGSSSGAMILDRNARVMTVVMNQPRIYMQIPERDEVQSPFVLDATMRFTRTGTGTGSVAGLPCVRWSIVSGKGMATACVTTDGVVLSESGVDGDGASGHLIARTVQYGPIDPKLFVPPPGYQRTAHPQGLGQGLGQGPGPSDGAVPQGIQGLPPGTGTPGGQ